MHRIHLKQIAMELVGLYLADLTKTEHRIAQSLITAGYLFVDQFYTLQRKIA